MDNQKISLDIRTILAQLNIDYERFVEWELNNQTGLWDNSEWIECSEDPEQQVAVALS
jgi:hypothetical protein